MAGMILAAFGIGLVVAMPPGPVTIATGQRAVSVGFWHALTFNLGSIVADTFYALLVYFGLAALLAESAPLRFGLWVLGGAWLVYLGVDAMRTTIDLHALDAGSGGLPRWRNFRSGLMVTLLNPLTVVSWIALAGNFFNLWRAEWPLVEGVGLFAIGAMLAGAMSWVVTLALSSVRRFVSPRLVRWVSVVSGALLVVYGLSAWVSAAGMLSGR
jgi:L-lysine exporter family protein LysE/ArgO